MTKTQPCTGVINNPDIYDLRIEAVLSHLLEDDGSFILTLTGQRIFASQLPKSLMTDAIVRRIISELCRENSVTFIETWMNRFLQFVLVDTEMFGLLNAEDSAIIAMAETMNIRTRTFEMLFGSYILHLACMRNLIQIDRSVCTVSTLMITRE